MFYVRIFLRIFQVKEELIDNESIKSRENNTGKGGMGEGKTYLSFLWATNDSMSDIIMEAIVKMTHF